LVILILVLPAWESQHFLLKYFKEVPVGLKGELEHLNLVGVNGGGGIHMAMIQLINIGYNEVSLIINAEK
jgi:hypothetical protein